VIKKDRGAEVAAWGAGFDTVTGMVAAAVNSAAGIVTVMVFELMETGVNMLDPKFTVAPVAKLLPVIVRYVRSVLPVKAIGGDSWVITGGAGGGGGGVVTVKNTCPVTEPDVAVICTMPAATPVATLPFTEARLGFSLLYWTEERVNGAPNWSVPDAVKAWVEPTLIDAFVGVMLLGAGGDGYGTTALRDASRGRSILAFAVEAVYSSDVWIRTHPRERESGHRKAKLI
jgi:hypothetical protein